MKKLKIVFKCPTCKQEWYKTASRQAWSYVMFADQMDSDTEIIKEECSDCFYKGLYLNGISNFDYGV